MRRLKPKGFIESSTLGVTQGRGWRYGWIGRRREKVRGVYRFSSLVKQNKKGKNYAVVCFAGFFFLKNLCYEVIVKQKIYKRSTNHFSLCLHGRTCQAVGPDCSRDAGHAKGLGSRV